MRSLPDQEKNKSGKALRVLLLIVSKLSAKFFPLAFRIEPGLLSNFDLHETASAAPSAKKKLKKSVCVKDGDSGASLDEAERALRAVSKRDRHVHNFAQEDERYDEEAQVWVKRCPCGLQVPFEKL